MKRDRFKQKVAVAAIYPPKGKPNAVPGLFFNEDEPLVAHHEQSYRGKPRCIPKGVKVAALHRGLVRALAKKGGLERCAQCFALNQWAKIIAEPGRYKVKKQKKAPEPEPTARKKVVERPYGATTLGDWVS